MTANSMMTLSVDAVWQSTAVAIVALAAVRLARRAPAAIRQAILAVALLKFLTPPLSIFPLGVFALVPRPQPTATVAELGLIQPITDEGRRALRARGVTGVAFDSTGDRIDKTSSQTGYEQDRQRPRVDHRRKNRAGTWQAPRSKQQAPGKPECRFSWEAPSFKNPGTVT